ncbi:MAG: hypothetical protein IPK44_01075 [Candidatus Accumulibacter sp.]|uniref:terminase large subunit domain-containing protein n=1 Tax=Accumulibacter sp. TaxID=2053492 RepID=UPI00258EE191|nr:terminase family protein [Accumulibacter sp.]MBK8113190.1 hypothetical protein [Accumulibacter sp.]
MNSDFTACSTCQVERLASTLDGNGQCPFCVDEGVPPPVPPTPPAPEPKYAQVTVVPSKNAGPRAKSDAPAIPRAARAEDQQAVNEAYTLPYAAPIFDIKKAEADPAKELALRALCRRRLLPFVQRFRPKYLAGWVHEDICRRLERFVRAVEAGESPRLLLLLPPRSGKSELGSRNFPPWVLGQHPDWEIIAASHTQSLTLSFSRYVRDLVRDPAYKAIFPDLMLDPASQSIENWNTLQGGGYMAAGVGTGISGRGCHILVVDDVVKDAEAADSVTIRENTWEWYISTAYTRLAPGGGVLGILTWWHEDDWAGRIQDVMKSGDGDVFEVVKYPAINEEGDEYILPDDTIQQFAPESDPPPEGSRLTRLRNTAIHPARYTTAMMVKIKMNLISSGLKRVWNALYQQNPVPDDGVYFTKEMMRWYTHPPRRQDMFVYQAWDFAITEKTDSDWTVCCTLGQDEADNLYVLHILRFRSGDGNAIVDDILDQYEMFKPDLIGFEDGQIWKSLTSQFKKRCDERKLYPNSELLQPLTDKKVRAGPLKGRMQNGKLFVRQNQPWTEQFRQELMKFPSGKYDDVVDSTSWAVRLTLTKSAPKAKAPPPQKSWKDKLRELTSGQGGHMAA